jgi:hypothetical protein
MQKTFLPTRFSLLAGFVAATGVLVGVVGLWAKKISLLR